MFEIKKKKRANKYVVATDSPPPRRPEAACTKLQAVQEIIIKRDILDVNYNIKHVIYFMVRNIKNAKKSKY